MTREGWHRLEERLRRHVECRSVRVGGIELSQDASHLFRRDEPQGCAVLVTEALHQTLFLVVPVDFSVEPLRSSSHPSVPTSACRRSRGIWMVGKMRVAIPLRHHQREVDAQFLPPPPLRPCSGASVRSDQELEVDTDGVAPMAGVDQEVRQGYPVVLARHRTAVGRSPGVCEPLALLSVLWCLHAAIQSRVVLSAPVTPDTPRP